MRISDWSSDVCSSDLPRESLSIDSKPFCRAIPLGKKPEFASIGGHVIGCERPGGRIVQAHQCIDRALIRGLFAARIFVEPVAHPGIAEILQQNPPSIGLRGNDLGRAQAVTGQILRNLRSAEHTSELQSLMRTS